MVAIPLRILLAAYSGRLHGEIAFWHNKNTIIEVCGAPLQIFHHIVLSCYHSHSGAPLDIIIVVALVGAPLKLDASMGIKNQTTRSFHIHYNCVMWCVAMTMISDVACRYSDILEWPPHLLIKPHQQSFRCLKNVQQP
jgi:hypothetical protein